MILETTNYFNTYGTLQVVIRNPEISAETPLMKNEIRLTRLERDALGIVRAFELIRKPTASEVYSRGFQVTQGDFFSVLEETTIGARSKLRSIDATTL